MAARVADLLVEKGRQVFTVRADNTVGAVALLLSDNRIGAAPVLDAAGRLVGMISERDLVRGLGQHGEQALALPVADLMTREVMTCAMTDAIVELMQVMTDHRIRHLPVVEHGRLEGMISIGDVVKQRLAEAQSEVEALREFIAA